MICLPFLCALVLHTESIRTNPINIQPACEAWEREKCEPDVIVETLDERRRLSIFDPTTGLLMPNIELYHQLCIADDDFDSVCESYVGEQFIEAAR